MAQTYDICIRGAGVVGRTLALLLARERLRVALVSPPEAPSANKLPQDVRAYALNAASRQLLESLRCWPDEAHATAVQEMQVYGDQEGALRFDAFQQNVPALAWIVEVPALEQRLGEAVRYQPQVDLVPAPVPAALTVICEGRASQTRAELGVDFETTRYPQHALATRVRCEQPHGQIARQWFSQEGVLAFLPLGGPEGQEVAVVWSLPAALATQAMDWADDALCHRLEAASQFALGRLELSGERATWPLQWATAERWCGDGGPDWGSGRWVLAGDAAHNVHPLAGQGLNLGLADAQALARILHGRDYWRSVGDMRLLRAYERERKAAILPMGWATDGLQQLFTRPESALQRLRNWGMNSVERASPLKAWLAKQAIGLG